MKLSATGVLLLTLLSALPAHAQAPVQAGPPWPAEVAIPSTHRLKFTSRVNNTPYTLFIRVPTTPPPPGGYPVVYVLDGDQHFGTASDVAMSIGMEFPGAAPVVVGIGYGAYDDLDVIKTYGHKPGDASPLKPSDAGRAFNLLRARDLTLPIADKNREPAWLHITPENVGGVDDFLKVIESEIKPKVAALVPVNPANQALFGHSLGGLATLHALLTEPQAFRTFIIASPSIYWNGRAVLNDEAAFSQAVTSGKANPRVLLEVGADEAEQSGAPPPALWASLTSDKKAELIAYIALANSWGGMVSNVRGLSDRLGALKGGPGYQVKAVIVPGEAHTDLPFDGLNRGMRFAFAPQP